MKINNILGSAIIAATTMIGANTASAQEPVRTISNDVPNYILNLPKCTFGISFCMFSDFYPGLGADPFDIKGQKGTCYLAISAPPSFTVPAYGHDRVPGLTTAQGCIDACVNYNKLMLEFIEAHDNPDPCGPEGARSSIMILD